MQKTAIKSLSKGEKKLNNSTSVFLKTQILMIILNIIFLLAGSGAVYGSALKQSNYFYVGTALFCVVSFIGGYYCGFKIHRNGLITGLVFCLPSNLLVILVSLISNRFKLDFTCVISLILLLVASMLGGILSVNTRKKAKTNRKGRKQ